MNLPPPPSPARTTIAGLLPAHVRAWVYAVLFIANAGLVAAEAAYGLPAWLAIVTAVINAAGFTLARSNTPA